MSDGIWFNGKHSYEDLGLTMPRDPQIGFPQKIKKKTRIPGTNIIIDSDEGRNTQEYTEREITVWFNIIDFSNIHIKNTLQIIERAANWLISPVGKNRLEIDNIPYYYFEAEVEGVENFETDMLKTGEAEIKFIAYPFKISKFREGHNLWNPFDLSRDVWQDVQFTLPDLVTQQLPFRQLPIGEMVILGSWTSIQSVGVNNVIRHYETEPFYEIVAKRTVETDHSNGWYGNTEYQLSNGYWVRDQNIIQARTRWLDVKLINVSDHPITPKVLHVPSDSGTAWRGITIQRDNNFYNLRGDVPRQAEYHNDSFQLLPGENDIRIYGQNNVVEFVWSKEVL